MMNIDHQLEQQLKTLRLGGILQSLEVRLRQAHQHSLGPINFLQLVIQDEIERREAKKLQQRLSRAAFEEEKSFEGFDFTFNPQLNTRAIRDLATCRFAQRRENVLLYGTVGGGKTHIAKALLGHQACRQGYTLLYTKAVNMFRFLLAGRADHSWERRLKNYISPDILIIDDFALTALNSIQAEDIYEIISVRHLKKSIIVTSNRPPQDWIALFPDPVLANSALDRLAHNAHHVIMEGESYRRKLVTSLSRDN